MSAFTPNLELGLTAAAAVELELNKLVSLNPEAEPKRLKLSGRTVCVEIQELELSLYFLFDPQKTNVRAHYEGTVSTTLQGTLGTWWQLKFDPEQHYGAVALNIQGDIATGQNFRELLDSLTIDGEELLSLCLSDLLAHRIHHTLHSAFGWGRERLLHWGLAVSDFLTEESRLTVHRHELNGFYADVDQLRYAADRLEARLARVAKLAGARA